MIAYTYIGRYALASGDPIGRPESLELVSVSDPREPIVDSGLRDG